jgi:HPt (histidine-containing phosphotransfer) domain-containing protein
MSTETPRPPRQANPIADIDAELADLMPRYLSNRWSDLANARHLLQRKDVPAIARIAHRIHGTAASYGFPRLGDIALAIENAARREDFDGVTEALADYDHFLRTVCIRYV